MANDLSKIQNKLTKQQFMSIIENSSDAIISVATPGDIITFCNRSTSELIGYEADEIIGRPILSLFSPEELEEISPLLKRVASGATIRQREVVCLDKNDRPINVSMTFSPMKSDSGGLFAYSVIIRTLSDSRIAEHKLGIRKELTEKAIASRNHFLAHMSHEIRSPMSSLIGIAKLLSDTDLSGEQRELVDAINYSGSSLLRLLDDLLDFEKIDAGVLRLIPNDFDLRAWLQGLMRSFRILASEKNIKLEYSVSDQLPSEVRGDSGRLRQILENLLNNAIKFTRDGEVSVKVTSGRSEQDRNLILKFELKDTGIGIPEALIPEIFVSFSEAHFARAEEFGGTGLGLAICKRLCEMMDGEIEVESEEGVGTTFRFFVVLQEATDGLSETDERGAIEEVAQLGSGQKILIAEDDLATQKFVKYVLEHSGYHCDIANNGSEAIEAWTSRSYDLIFMDVMMPLMNGFEATKAIRVVEDKVGKHTPIVALTARVSQSDQERCAIAGMDDYLPKPTTFKELLAMLRKLNLGQ